MWLRAYQAAYLAMMWLRTYQVRLLHCLMQLPVGRVQERGHGAPIGVGAAAIAQRGGFGPQG